MKTFKEILTEGKLEIINDWKSTNTMIFPFTDEKVLIKFVKIVKDILFKNKIDKHFDFERIPPKVMIHNNVWTSLDKNIQDKIEKAYNKMKK